MIITLDRTARGFAVAKFADAYGHGCSIQKSSLATDDAIWFGIDDAAPKILASKAGVTNPETGEMTGWVPYPIPEDVLLTTRMHLTRENVAALLPILQSRIADYPQVLAEGGANFWDAFHLVPVGAAFWHDGVRLEVFPVRHHWPETAYGLRLQGSLVWTGDTRPIPEALAKYADAGERVAHDCSLHGNPSHSGIEDLEREYPAALLQRCVLYHYASAEEGDVLAARGYHVARSGEVLALQDTTAARISSA